MRKIQELIKVNFDTQTVSARELHEKLNIETAFKDWFPRMREYGFEDGIDFNMLKIERVQIEGNREVKRELIDYELSVRMAKEISMIQRTEIGRKIRNYFMDLEDAWNTPEQIFARALKMAGETIHNLKTDVNRMRPKEIFADAVATSHTSILIGDLSKLIKQNGVEIGQKRLFEWMRDNGYLIKRKGADWNSPTQRSMEKQLFEVKETAVTHADGHVTVNKTTKVTGKGQQYFINKFLVKAV